MRAILISALLFITSCDDRGTQVWDASLPWSVKEFHTQNAMRFADAVHQATDGQLTIKIHPGGALGLKGPGSLRALSEGIVDMAEMPAFQQVGAEPLLGLDSLPFLVRNHDELAILYKIMQPRLEAVFAKNNIKIIYMVPWPNQNIYTRSEMTSLDDLQGIKIRTYDKNTSELMERLGLAPIQMPSGDVVSALASNVVDAVMTSTTTGAAQNYWDFLSHIHRTNHVWISNFMAVNIKSWNALSPTVQTQVLATAHRLQPDFWEVSKADDLDKLALLVKNGITVVEPSAKLMADMQALARPMWEEYAIRVGDDAREIINTFLLRTERAPL